MAERRMFSKTIIDSDLFLDMPLSAQALYFHLSMRADDDGFLNNAQKIIRMTNASKNDFDLLRIKSFIIKFEDGICVIKHWRIHNYIRSDRYKPTLYQDKIKKLKYEENKSYRLNDETFDNGIPDGYQMDTQNSLGKDRIDKTSKGEVRTGEENKNQDTSDKAINLQKGIEGQVDASAPISQERFDIDKKNTCETDKTKSGRCSLSEDTKESCNDEKSSRKNLIKIYADDEQVKEIMNRWNSINVSRIVSMKSRRLKLLNERINENGIETFLMAVEKVNNSSFLKGENKRGWVISFDWLIKADNFSKVLNGRYDSNAEYYTDKNKKNKFNNFKPREYDYNSLEKKLLGWEKDE